MTPKTANKDKPEPQVKDTVAQLEAEILCVHHWIIEPPNGPVSKGVCKLCGAEKNFENWEGASTE